MLAITDCFCVPHYFISNYNFILQNNAINNLNEVLRQQNKRFQHIHHNNEELSDAIQQIEKHLKVTEIIGKLFKTLDTLELKLTK